MRFPLIHFIRPPESFGFRQGLIIEGYSRKDYAVSETLPNPPPPWLHRIASITLLWHITLGKRRLCKFDYDRREGLARSMYWVRFTWHCPWYLHDVFSRTYLRNAFDVARGVSLDER
ncbi:MAG: hypothetical protein V4641_05730 [Pseudomonadota bacterium]